MNTQLNPALAKKLLPNKFYDTFFLNEYGRLESLRAARYSTNFSTVLIKVESSQGGKGGKTAQKADFTQKLASIVVECLRGCDVAGFTDDGNVSAILPDTDYFGSLITLKKIKKAADALIKKNDAVTVTFSRATYPRDGKNYGELLSSANSLVDSMQESLRDTLSLDNMLFWEIVAKLFSSNTKELQSACFDSGSDHTLPVSIVDRINEQLVREVGRSPHRRGILYITTRKDAPVEHLSMLLATAGKTNTKMFVVGTDRDRLKTIRNASIICFDDPRLSENFFTFYLGEDSGYAIVGRENWGETFSCFHTADEYLVEGLITKFQNEYQLQEQLG